MTTERASDGLHYGTITQYLYWNVLISLFGGLNYPVKW